MLEACLELLTEGVVELVPSSAEVDDQPLGVRPFTAAGTRPMPGNLASVRKVLRDPWQRAMAAVGWPSLELLAPGDPDSYWVRVAGHAVGPVQAPSDEATQDDATASWSVEGEGRDALSRTMRELGLTSSEADAFLAAWDATLFGGAPPAAIDVLTADDQPAAPPTEQVSFVYFLPEAAVGGIATVVFEPRPRAFRRAFAVWLTP